jgi:hypothetical protein
MVQVSRVTDKRPSYGPAPWPGVYMIERNAQLLGRWALNPIRYRTGPAETSPFLRLKALETEEMDTSLDTCLGFSYD